ncbi:hypothetical protein HHI36_016631, partial [Cryptolaemus montrouzieri]
VWTSTNNNESFISVIGHYITEKWETITNLLQCVNWSNALNNLIPIDVIYLDFAKAFDTARNSSAVFG